MSKQFWDAVQLATLSLYIFYAAFMLVFMINGMTSGQGTNRWEVGIAGAGFVLLTSGYAKLLQIEKTDVIAANEEPRKIDKFLMVILLISLAMEGIIFSVYAVMFIMAWNQEPPYPYKWIEITMFWVMLVSLVIGIIALIKNLRTPKKIESVCECEKLKGRK